MSDGETPRQTGLRSRRGRRRNPEVDERDRAVVLAKAEGLLEHEGADALSVRRLAKELGTSYQLVYTLFGGKQGLLDALFQHGFARLENACRSHPESASARDDLAKLALVYRAFAHEHRELYSLMFGRDAGFEPSAASRRVARKSFRVVQECAERAYSTSAAARRNFVDAEALGRAAWSATHGHVAFELASWFGAEPNAASRLEETVRALVGDDELAGESAG